MAANGSKTALIVMDAQNDFLASTGGAFESVDACYSVAKLVGNLRKLLTLCHYQEIPVAFSRLAFPGAFEDPFGLFGRMLLLRHRTWGTDLHCELRTSASDTLLHPRTNPDAFCADLGHFTDQTGARRLIFCGPVLSPAIVATAYSALRRDFEVIIAADATGGLGRDSRVRTLSQTLPLAGCFVLSIDQIEELLTGDPADLIARNEPLLVYSSDGGLVGKLGRAKQDQGAYLVIHPLRPNSVTLAVPRAAIAVRTARAVYLRLPGAVIDQLAQGWLVDFKNKKAEAA